MAVRWKQTSGADVVDILTAEFQVPSIDTRVKSRCCVAGHKHIIGFRKNERIYWSIDNDYEIKYCPFCGYNLIATLIIE